MTETAEEFAAKQTPIEPDIRAVIDANRTALYSNFEAAMTETVSVPRDPTIEMISAAMDDLGWWVEPYTAPREGGVATDGDISAHDAAIINSQQMEVVASALKAALAVAPTPPQNTDGEAARLRELIGANTVGGTDTCPAVNADGLVGDLLGLLSTLKAERDALRADLTRYIDIATKEATEAESLRTSRADILEEAARVAEGEVVHHRYRTWPFYKAKADWDQDNPLVTHSDEIAAAIRALVKP